jgi:hypothetical protein
MHIKNEIAEHKTRLTEQAIARLLGISLPEYRHLSHKPLKAAKDLKGNIVEFYMQISNNNEPEVISKINPSVGNIVWFTRQQVESHYI